MPTPLRSLPAAETPTARVVSLHSLPGRVRFRVDGLYRDHTFQNTIERELNRQHGVRAVAANPLTGTVVVRYDPSALNAEAVAACIIRHVPAAAAKAPGAKAPEAVPAARTAAHPSAAQPEHTWHALERTAVGKLLGSDPQRGLAAVEATTRLAHYGPNELVQAKTRSDLSIFFGQFASLPVGLLGVSAAVALLTGGPLDAAIITGVVLINAGIGYLTERNAERTINALTRMTPRSAQVVRDGVTLDVQARELVVGDLISLTPGTYIPADLRLLRAHRLTVDESALTGESMPVAKDADLLVAADTALGDRANMAYMGTLVSGGSGNGAVVATATATELGRIQSLVAAAEAPETPMQRQLGSLGTQLALLSGAVCVGVFGTGLLRGYSVLEMLKSSISLAVAAVPEGLPAVATTTLALGIQQMRRHRVAVRRLDAVETLGSVQVFCLDKTGTLTQNRMTAVAVQAGGRLLELEDGRFFHDGAVVGFYDTPELARLVEVVSLCSEAQVSDGAEPQVTGGSPTETAMVELAIRAGVDVAGLRRRNPALQTLYRAEGRPFMVTLHRQEDGRRLVAVKGSPERVLDLCDQQVLEGGPADLDEMARGAIVRANERMAGEALRVLGVACGYLEEGDELGESLPALHWLGLVGMADPLRKGMPELMGQFHRAGIRTVMITGDQSATAYAIGKQLGLSGSDQLQILDSATLDRLEPELLAGLVRQVHVFSRVSPAHKLRIVQALQAGGQIVAMTGDGINDGPALKAADIGVAMGGSGTDVARSVADVVLEDDNLHTMVEAVSHGRTIYANIRKSVHFLLSTNFSEIEVMLAGIAIGQGTPLNAMQLLWINLISDIFPGLALALEPPEPDVLERAPRDPREPIVQRRALKRMGFEATAITAGTMASYLYALSRYGAGPRASTQAFTTLSFAQLLHALSCRSDSRSLFVPGALPHNRYLTLALGASLGVQALAAFVPGLRALLGTTALGPVDAAVAAAGALLPLLVNETTKTLTLSHQEEQP